MNVYLTRELGPVAHNGVQSGRYNPSSEVVQEALRLMEDQDQLKPLRREEVQMMIDQGLESLRLGEGIDGETLFAQFEAELDELERAGHK